LLCLNVPASPEIYTLSLHDALPIYEDVVGAAGRLEIHHFDAYARPDQGSEDLGPRKAQLSARSEEDDLQVQAGQRGEMRGLERRSEEHTSELQSLTNLVCRLLLQKK